MQTFKSLRRHIGELFNALSGTYGNFQHCHHCGQTTVWDINPMQGRYRCTKCDQGPEGA